jgi:hypothetical protein
MTIGEGSGTLSGTFSRLGAFALSGTSRDAALNSILTAGAYTAQVSAAPGTGTGVALVEFYDADASGAVPTGNLVNLSARNQVGTGDNILIAGLVVSGYAPKTVLVRGIGPTLGQFGVGGALQSVRLQIYNGSTLLAENAGWGGTAALAGAFSQVGAFGLPGNSQDSAILITLQPGVVHGPGQRRPKLDRRSVTRGLRHAVG